MERSSAQASGEGGPHHLGFNVQRPECLKYSLPVPSYTRTQAGLMTKSEVPHTADGGNLALPDIPHTLGITVHGRS